MLPTVLALGIRLFTLTRPGFLTGISEYDDGVYLGAAIRLTQGALPYRDFAFVQPPGILLVMTPAAVVAKVAGTATAMSFARLLTVLASTACVPLAGNLVRHRGTLVTAVTCGILAVYPDDIAAAHTLLLEPWMNLFCLIAATAAFSHGMLARPARLAWYNSVLRMKVRGAASTNGAISRANPATSPARQAHVRRIRCSPAMRQSTSSIAPGTTAQNFTAPATPSAAPAQASRAGRASMPWLKAAVAAIRQNRFIQGSSSSVWAAAMSSG